MLVYQMEEGALELSNVCIGYSTVYVSPDSLSIACRLNSWLFASPVLAGIINFQQYCFRS